MGWFVGWAFGGCVWGGRFNRRRCLHAHQVFFKIFILTQVFFTGPCASETRSSEITPIKRGCAKARRSRSPYARAPRRPAGFERPCRRGQDAGRTNAIMLFDGHRDMLHDIERNESASMRTPFPRQYHRSQQTLRLLTLALAVHCWPAWQLKQESRP